MAERIAVVTGGNKGIGFEICRQLGRKGINVVLTARNAARGQKAANTLQAEGLNVVFHALDEVCGLGAERDLPRDRTPESPRDLAPLGARGVSGDDTLENFREGQLRN